MEDTIKIELLTPLTGTFLPNEMEQDWEEEDYNDFEEIDSYFVFDGCRMVSADKISELLDWLIYNYDRAFYRWVYNVAFQEFSVTNDEKSFYNQFKGVTITMNTNLNRILYIFAGICFIFTYFLTKNFTYLPLGLCSLILSTNKKREDR